jgi:hypothetical protein
MQCCLAPNLLLFQVIKSGRLPLLELEVEGAELLRVRMQASLQSFLASLTQSNIKHSLFCMRSCSGFGQSCPPSSSAVNIVQHIDT